jgi:hypothetical protein
MAYDAPKDGETPRDLLTRLLAMDPDEYNLMRILESQSIFEGMVVETTARILQQLNFLKTTTPVSIEDAQSSAAKYFALMGIKKELEAGVDEYHRERAEAYSILDKKVTIKKLKEAGQKLSRLLIKLHNDTA